MALNPGVRCSPHLSTVGVTGVTEARKLFGQADHRADEAGEIAGTTRNHASEIEPPPHLCECISAGTRKRRYLSYNRETFPPTWSQFAVVRAGSSPLPGSFFGTDNKGEPLQHAKRIVRSGDWGARRPKKALGRVSDPMGQHFPSAQLACSRTAFHADPKPQSAFSDIKLCQPGPSARF